MTDAESTPITGVEELTTNDGDGGAYAALNDWERRPTWKNRYGATLIG